VSTPLPSLEDARRLLPDAAPEAVSHFALAEYVRLNAIALADEARARGDHVGALRALGHALAAVESTELALEYMALTDARERGTVH
jgi:hypothetical protein